MCTTGRGCAGGVDTPVRRYLSKDGGQHEADDCRRNGNLPLAHKKPITPKTNMPNNVEDDVVGGEEAAQHTHDRDDGQEDVLGNGEQLIKMGAESAP
jgi:hypothetical protein